MAFVKASSGSTTGGAGGTGVFTATLSFSPTTATDQIIVMVNARNSAGVSLVTGNLTSVTDNAGGGSSTYTLPTGGFAALTGNARYGGWLFYCTSVGTGVTTITANFSSGATAIDFVTFAVAEY